MSNKFKVGDKVTLTYDGRDNPGQYEISKFNVFDTILVSLDDGHVLHENAMYLLAVDTQPAGENPQAENAQSKEEAQLDIIHDIQVLIGKLAIIERSSHLDIVDDAVRIYKNLIKSKSNK